MKKHLIITTLVLISLSLMGMGYYASQTNKLKKMPTFENYESEWRKVQAAENEQRTQDAKKLVEAIYNKAQEEKNDPQIVKSLLHLLKYDQYTSETSQEDAVKRMQEAIMQAQQPTKAILQNLLAESYWQYYRSERYRILERSQISTDEVATDFKTWDAVRFAKEIRSLYEASLEPEKELQKIPIEAYSDLLTKVDDKNNFRELRPSMYDLLAHRAIAYFQDESANITKAADQFKLRSESAFADASTFAKTKFENTDELSAPFYALQLYQKLTAYHLNDAKPDALLDLSLKRLQFAKAQSTLADKDSRYGDALKALADKYPNSPESAQATYEWANWMYEKARTNANKPALKHHRKAAFDACQTAIDKHPNSRGAKNAKHLQEMILNKGVSVETEHVYEPEKPVLTKLTYTNLEKVYVRLIELTDEVVERRKRRGVNREELFKFYNKLSSAKDAKGKPLNWTVELPNDGLYNTHSTELEIPALDKGPYVLLVGTDKQFSFNGDAIAHADIWVSNLGFLQTIFGKGEQYLFETIDRFSGAIAPDVDYQLYREGYDYNTRKDFVELVDEGSSDANGEITISRSKVLGNSNRRYNNSYRLVLRKGEDHLEARPRLGDHHSHHYNKKKASIQTFYFTDRSIYRPGQKVYFKALCMTLDGYGKNQLKTGESIDVTLYDVNGQEVEKQTFRTNDYGSIAGEFQLPTGLLNGQMTLRSDHGSSYFSVEEYKRPKFEVEFKPVEGNYKLLEEVSVTGTAKAYAGANIDGAKVSYRVIRRARFPYWCWWWRPAPSSPEIEIANGTAETDDEGKFTINFKAIPDETISPKDQPVYTYQVMADVTDINGETRSGSTNVQVGTVALNASITIPTEVDQAEGNSFPVKTTNLSGQHQSSKVTIEVYSLKSPDRIFRDRYWGEVSDHSVKKDPFNNKYPQDIYENEDRTENWEELEKVFETTMTTEADSEIIFDGMESWNLGAYRIKLRTKDAFGTAVNWQRDIKLFNNTADKVPTNELFWVKATTEPLEPGEEFLLTLGSAAKNVRYKLQVQFGNEVIREEWLTVDAEQISIPIKVKEEWRGNFGVSLTAVKYGRLYSQNFNVGVPWSNKELEIELQTFRSKLSPGEEEEWRLLIKGADGNAVAAELLAGMYDASLDAYRGHQWGMSIYPSRYYYNQVANDNFFGNQRGSVFAKQWNNREHYFQGQSFEDLNRFGFALGHYFGGYGSYYLDGITLQESGHVTTSSSRAGGKRAMRNKKMASAEMAPPPPAPMAMDDSAEVGDVDAVMVFDDRGDTGGYNALPETAKKKPVKIRKNLQETAFFYPQLRTDGDGAIILSFKSPEALTRWNLMLLGHTKDLSYHIKTEEVVTQKELMVMPNTPRFLREGDQLRLSTKVTNLSDKDLDGRASLEFFDVLSGETVGLEVANEQQNKFFQVDAKKSANVSWNIKVPDGTGPLRWRIIARAGKFSDGEENVIPVLTDRKLVTETLPLPVRGQQSKTFEFENLKKAEASSTLEHHRLTLEMTSNPAWYAVQALPYLMEFPHECTEQIFSRFYANSIASHIANSDPRIASVFKEWSSAALAYDEKAAAGGDANEQALWSQLHKNQSLKSALLEQTPWVMEAKDESERKHRLGTLLNMDRMSSELKGTLKELIQRQNGNGAWPWFPGMRDSRFITQHLVAGMGHLKQLGVLNIDEDPELKAMLTKALRYLDLEVKRDYEELKRWSKNIDKENVGRYQIHYLYARSFFNEQPIANSANMAFKYYKAQAEKQWTNHSRYTQSMIALMLHRFDKGDSDVPGKILEAFRQNATKNEEMGMYFKLPNSWYWYEAPIETQALIIEAFSEIANDQEAVNELKVWLLKQKQTQDWKTTKATAEACYALLLQGDNWLAEDALVTMRLGEELIAPTNVESGTGYYQVQKAADEITADMGKIIVDNPNKGVAWGAAYWQYFEDLDKITPAETPLSIKKALFLEENSANGPVITPLTEGQSLKVGDKVKVRVEIRVDRDMEYVHLQDMRASGLEPINVLSRYKYQDGLGYYESTRDASTDFFMDHLPKGTYVFEYPLRASVSGDFSNGIATMQCMYAPEFSSHSAGRRVVID